jgi:hypothetical protein
MSALPRKSIFLLNIYELGWLQASIPSETMKRMEKECHTMWLMFQVAMNDVYANSEGHPFQKQAKHDKIKYEVELTQAITKEKSGEVK